MLLSFELSMPGVNSWNGRWTGESKPHARVLKVGSGCKAKPGRYEYDFGDGWRAAVTVRQVDGATARKLRKDSAGFCGYDWMIDEIRFDGRIKTLAERTAKVKPINKPGRESAAVGAGREIGEGEEF